MLLSEEGRDGSRAPSDAAATEGSDLGCVKIQRRYDAFDEVKDAARRAYEGGDYSFVENSTFQFVIVLMMSLSCLLIGFEMDNPDAQIYPILQCLLFVVFVFEIVSRAMHYRREFFCGSAELLWNWLDVVVVVASALNLWVMPLLIALTPLEKDSPLMHEFAVAAELGRLLRILSLARLFKNIHQLMSLLIGVAHGVASMMWVMVLMMLFLYAAGLVAVGVMRDGLVFGGKENTPDIVLETFADVPESMFVFFKILNGDLDQIKVVFEVFPFLEIVYALFVVVSSWVILSILTAVVSDAMVNSSESASKEKDQHEKELRDRETRETLIEIFNEIDSDKKGSVERVEFNRMLEDEALSQKLTQAAGLQIFDLVELFDLLENDSVINCESFVVGLMNEARNVDEHQIMKLEQRLKRAEAMVREVRTAVQAIKSQRRAARPKSTEISLKLPQAPTEISLKLPQAPPGVRVLRLLRGARS